MTKRKPKKDKLKPLPYDPPWEKRQHQANKVGIVLFIVLAFGLVIGFNLGFQATHDPAPTTTTVSTNHNSTITPVNPAPPTNNGNNSNWSPTPTNTSNPNSPPPPVQQATLAYGMVNGFDFNWSQPAWITFNGTSGVFNVSMTVQSNVYGTNTWWDYAVVLPSNISYFVLVHQPGKTWITLQWNVVPSGQSFSQNFNTTGNAF